MFLEVRLNLTNGLKPGQALPAFFRLLTILCAIFTIKLPRIRESKVFLLVNNPGGKVIMTQNTKCPDCGAELLPGSIAVRNVEKPSNQTRPRLRLCSNPRRFQSSLPSNRLPSLFSHQFLPAPGFPTQFTVTRVGIRR